MFVGDLFYEMASEEDKFMSIVHGLARGERARVPELVALHGWERIVEGMMSDVVLVKGMDE